MWDIKSSLLKVEVQDFDVNDSALVDPNDASTFEQGDWYCFDPNNPNHIGPVGVATTEATPGYAFPVWSKRGEGSVQMTGKLAVILLGQMTADTDRFDAAQVYVPGTALSPTTGGVLTTTAVTGGTTMAICVLPPESNNGLLRVLTIR